MGPLVVDAIGEGHPVPVGRLPPFPAGLCREDLHERVHLVGRLVERILVEEVPARASGLAPPFGVWVVRGRIQALPHTGLGMILYVSVILLSVLTGYLVGGRLRGFERLHLRYWWLAPIGLGLQAFSLPEARHGTDLLVRMAVLGASYALLLIFAGINFRIPGMPLLLVGLTLNAVVVIANGGMPASRHALEASGQTEALKHLTADPKHHLMTSADHLTPLAFVFTDTATTE